MLASKQREQRTSARASLGPAAAEAGSLGAKSVFMMVAAGLLAAASLGCEKSRTPCLFELPEGFRGWVLIRFEHSECPPLPLEQGRLVFRIPATGVLCTSNSMETGVAKDEFRYSGNARTPIPSTGWGGGGGVWLESNGQCGTGPKPAAILEHFFIGTEAEANSPPPMPEDPACR